MPNIILRQTYVCKADPSIRFYNEAALKAYIEANLSNRALAFWDIVYEAFDLEADSSVHVGGNLAYLPKEVLTRTVTNEKVTLRAVSANTAIDDTYIRFNGSLDAVETLPKGLGRGRSITFKNISDFKWTLQCSGGDNIDGQSSLILTKMQSVTLVDNIADTWDIT